MMQEQANRTLAQLTCVPKVALVLLPPVNELWDSWRPTNLPCHEATVGDMRGHGQLNPSNHIQL